MLETLLLEMVFLKSVIMPFAINYLFEVCISWGGYKELVVLRLHETAGRNTVTKIRLFDDTFEVALSHHGVKTLLVKDGKAIETDFMEWGK